MECFVNGARAQEMTGNLSSKVRELKGNWTIYPKTQTNKENRKIDKNVVWCNWKNGNQCGQVNESYYVCVGKAGQSGGSWEIGAATEEEASIKSALTLFP